MDDVKKQGDSNPEIPLLKQPILGNTLVFLDTNFFKSYKNNSETHKEIFNYSKNGGIILCTSWLCLEEWRNQLINHMRSTFLTNKSNLQNKWYNDISSHCGQNIFSDTYIKDELIEKINSFFDRGRLLHGSQQFIDRLIKDNKIEVFPILEEHIKPTFDDYFNARPPYNGSVATQMNTNHANKADMPDAFIYAAIKDVLSKPEFKSNINKVFFASDDKLKNHVQKELNFTTLSLPDLIKQIKDYDENQLQGTQNNPQNTLNLSQNISVANPNQSPLDNLLSKALTEEHQDIWLRLLGFVTALNSPTHDNLENIVAYILNLDRETVSTQAKYLASSGYIKNTGNHYIIGNKSIGKEASDRIIDDIIKALELENNE